MRIRRRRFALLAKANSPPVAMQPPRAGRCNYPIEQGKRFCRMSAGRGTLHPGSGYCDKHDKLKVYDPIHRYRGVKQKDIRQQLRNLQNIERNIFDLIPEIQLMRALLLDYIERHYEFKEAVLAWYKDGKAKPKGPVDIIEASHLIEAVSRLIERHHRIERAGSIDLTTFQRATEQMGIIVAKHVRDGKVLEAIERDWQLVSLDTKAAPSLPMGSDTQPLALPEPESEPEGDLDERGRS